MNIFTSSLGIVFQFNWSTFPWLIILSIISVFGLVTLFIILWDLKDGKEKRLHFDNLVETRSKGEISKLTNEVKALKEQRDFYKIELEHKRDILIATVTKGDI